MAGSTAQYASQAISPHLMRVHLVRNSTMCEVWKTPSNIHLVLIYSTSANKKSCVLSKNSLSAKFALSE